MVSNGGPLAASLLDVAIKAAVQAGAPRRTVAATAAAVTSVILAGGSVNGASGEATEFLSTSQQRRAKRKKATAKAAKEAAAAESYGKEPDVGATVTQLGSASGLSASAVLASDLTAGLPDPAPMPRNRCSYCAAEFASRNQLFKHLKDSGHSKFYDIGADDDVSMDGLSAAHSESSMVRLEELLDRLVPNREDASRVMSIIGASVSKSSGGLSDSGSTSSKAQPSAVPSSPPPPRAQRHGRP